MKRVCVVGSGPSGMYATKFLLKSLEKESGVVVDIFDSLPTPFGLVRYGVAPDHQDVKSVEVDFNDILSSKHVNFFGNVQVGKDLPLTLLSSIYSAVVLCYGANGDKNLSLPVKDIKTNQTAEISSSHKSSILNSRDFVYWYNGHPFYQTIDPRLKEYKNAVIIGQGNVAIDCARILTKPIDELATSDITEKALSFLGESTIEKVRVVGRRGPVQAAFTIKEVRELTRLSGTKTSIPKAQFDNGMNAYSQDIANKQRAKKRMNELLRSIVDDGSESKAESLEKSIEFNFLRSPKEILVQDGQMKSISFAPQELIEDKVQNLRNAAEEVLDCDFLIKSLGFRGENLDPDFTAFDEVNGVVKHGGIGKVEDEIFSNTFTAGWIKRAPSGIVGSNIVCAKQTVSTMLELFAQSTESNNNIDPTAEVKELLNKKNIQFVNYGGWKRIDVEEQRRGKLNGKNKPREKITSIEEMLKIAGC